MHCPKETSDLRRLLMNLLLQNKGNKRIVQTETAWSIFIFIRQSLQCHCPIVRVLEILPQCENNHGSICNDAKHSNEEIQKTENYLYMAFKNQVLFWRTGFVHDKIFTLVHKKTVPCRLESSPERSLITGCCRWPVECPSPQLRVTISRDSETYRGMAASVSLKLRLRVSAMIGKDHLKSEAVERIKQYTLVWSISFLAPAMAQEGITLYTLVRSFVRS